MKKKLENLPYNTIKGLEPKKKIKKKSIYYCIYYEIYALTKRLYLQTKRRPSILIAGIIQPLLWLLLFGALFQNAPVGLFTSNIKYNNFLSPGIIIFTSFTASINAGLPLMFDREFGFLNRLLISPLKSRDSLLISTILFIITVTILQTIFITIFNIIICNSLNQNIVNIIITILTILLITLSTASISICLAFMLPGHIEFLAFILIINLPMLFSSTALAPLSFMPYWLQIIASLNPLTHAIEIIRYLFIHNNTYYNVIIIKNLWLNFKLYESIYILICISLINFIIVKNTISYKLE